jgi:hypothetical protein
MNQTEPSVGSAEPRLKRTLGKERVQRRVQSDKKQRESDETARWRCRSDEKDEADTMVTKKLRKKRGFMLKSEVQKRGSGSEESENCKSLCAPRMRRTKMILTVAVLSKVGKTQELKLEAKKR